MKKLLLLLLTAVSLMAKAQAPFPAFEFIDINKIKARVMVHGDMFWDPNAGVAACEFPQGSGKHANFASALWMSGYDAGNQLHVAAQTYRQDGNDYWPGPLTAGSPINYATSYQWAKIWKVNRNDILSFQSLGTHTLANTPLSILQWPGNGNTYARGNGGTSLTVSSDMAPFVDLNSNGIYEPLLGEYPNVKGDQALWWVFNDNGPSHNQSSGNPLGVEVRAMAYAYNRGTVIDNMLFFDFGITNRSTANYSNYRIGLFDDIDLGYAFDDYIGFDSSHRMGICYNAIPNDGGGAGNPVNSYGMHVPVAGVSLIVLPGDAGSSYVPAGGFSYFNNDFSVIGNPTNDSQFNYYLRSKLRNGQPFTDDYAPGVPCKGYGSGPASNYVFTGDPSISTQWSECACNNPMGDRRFIISSNDFTLNAGSTQHVVMAFIVTDTNQGGCGSGLNYNNIKDLADTAWNVYHNPLPPVVNYVPEHISTADLVAYPNPANDQIYVENPGGYSGAERITIYNTVGQQMQAEVTKKGNRYEAGIGHLPAGLYYVNYRDAETQRTMKFVKE